MKSKRTITSVLVAILSLAGCTWAYNVSVDIKTNLQITNDGQILDVSLNCPKFIFNTASTAEGIVCKSVAGNISSGKVVTVSYDKIVLNSSVSIEPQLLLQWSPDEKIVRKWVRYRLTGNVTNMVLQEIILEKMNKNILSAEPFFNPPQSYPAFANGFFIGIEFPIASLRIEDQNFIIGHKPGLRPEANVWYESRKAIYGAAQSGKERKAFEDYISSHRPQPTGLHINYNSWYAAQYPGLGDDNFIPLMQKFKDNLVTPYGVSFDSFTLDNGWSITKSVWDINTAQQSFPNGFTNVQKYAQSMGTNLGIWSSPAGMYVGAIDTNWVEANGYETYKQPTATLRLCCIAGPRYKNTYKDKLIKLATTYNVRHFKFDGFEMSCNATNHGHEPNELSAEAMAQGGIDVFQAVHAASPQTWLEATCFSWGKIGSPWWLFYVNSITGAFGDDNPIGKIPCPIYQESSTTSRDYYNLQGAALMPIPINAQEVMGVNHVTQDPYVNEAITVIMRGHGFLPMYIKPDCMNPQRWATLAKLLTWTRSNSETILANTYPLLPASWQNGNVPKFSNFEKMPREIYGYAHCKDNKGLILLRNPWIMPQTYTIKIDENIGFTSPTKELSAVSLYPENRIYGQNMKYGSTLTFQMAPYETIVLSIGSGYNIKNITSVDSSIGGKIKASVTQSNAGKNFVIDVNATVDSTAPQTKLLVCMEGDYKDAAALATPTYQLTVNGVPANVTVLSSADGWRATGIQEWEHWKFLQVDLTSAHNEISLRQLQPDPNCTNVSVWVWVTKDGNGGTMSFANSLPSPEFIYLDAALLGEFKRD